MDEEGEVFIKKHKNWDIYSTHTYVLAVSSFGNKRIQVYIFDKSVKRVECVVRINDSKNNNYIATVSNGQLIETCFSHYNNEIVEKKNNLKEYLPVIHTLPKNIKDSLNSLVL